MSVIQARPTLYKGIKMRSRLEADYAATLDRDGCSWEYEPTCFAGENDQWLPDFGIAHHDMHTYVELKPAYLLERKDAESASDYIGRIDAILTRMSVAWQSEAKANLELVFWTYGASEPVFSVLGFRTHPWMAFTAGFPVVPMLWSGMGQLDALMPESNRHHLEAS
jgi:hypothetical protein